METTVLVHTASISTQRTIPTIPAMTPYGFSILVLGSVLSLADADSTAEARYVKEF